MFIKAREYRNEITDVDPVLMKLCASTPVPTTTNSENENAFYKNKKDY